MKLRNNKSRPVGEDLEGRFEISYQQISGPLRPIAEDIELRLIGKIRLSDPDSQAIFDLTNGAGLEITGSTEDVITGQWEVAGSATADLRPRPGQPTVVIQYEFLATYAGRPQPVRLERGSFQLLADRILANH